MFCFGFGKTKKRFLVLQWYFDLSKQQVLVLPKPKQNHAGQLLDDGEAMGEICFIEMIMHFYTNGNNVRIVELNLCVSFEQQVNEV